MVDHEARISDGGFLIQNPFGIDRFRAIAADQRYRFGSERVFEPFPAWHLRAVKRIFFPYRHEQFIEFVPRIECFVRNRNCLLYGRIQTKFVDDLQADRHLPWRKERQLFIFPHAFGDGHFIRTEVSVSDHFTHFIGVFVRRKIRHRRRMRLADMNRQRIRITPLTAGILNPVCNGVIPRRHEHILAPDPLLVYDRKSDWRGNVGHILNLSLARDYFLIANRKRCGRQRVQINDHAFTDRIIGIRDI
ncbi:hypothetical protein D3C76_160030 [compost metagenome]